MGIPKYFKYITSSYDSLTIDSNVKDFQINNLYFDLNCLIHPCVRKVCKDNPSDVSSHNKELNTDKYLNDESYITKLEHKIYLDIQNSIDNIIKIVNPTRLVYLAIDGVAPRAKMEQQRIRRYRTIKEKELTNKVYKDYNYQIVHDDIDTNFITPGTIFMYKLSLSLQKYLINKNKTSKLLLILDDSQNVGEGEHKIFQHIKNTANTEFVNCVYGLDADLIMLSLCNIYKIYLIREEVHFGKVDMNKYLYLDIEKLKTLIYDAIVGKILYDDFQPKSEIIKQNIINDYITLCFFIGNDFLPHIVGIDISNDSINMLINTYVEFFRYKSTNLVANGKINLVFLKHIINSLYANENKYLLQYQDYISNKRPYINQKLDSFNYDLEKIKYYPIFNKTDGFVLGEANWQNNYYKYYFNLYNIHKNKTFINDICKNYIDGLQWNVDYYLNECPSYTWYYQYRSAPCLRELSQYMLKRVYIQTFDNTIKYSPLEQLAIVLPIQSSNLWAIEYAKLIKKDIKLVSFYPINFELEVMNKMYLHECNPILALVDDEYIKEKFKAIKLTEFEKKRNIVSGCYIYEPKK